MGAEASVRILAAENLELLYLHLHRLQLDRLLLARQFVGGHATDFLSGERRRHLFNYTPEPSRLSAELFWIKDDIAGRRGRLALRVVGVGGKTEADCAFVGLLRMGIELR